MAASTAVAGVKPASTLKASSITATAATTRPTPKNTLLSDKIGVWPWATLLIVIGIAAYLFDGPIQPLESLSRDSDTAAQTEHIDEASTPPPPVTRPSQEALPQSTLVVVPDEITVESTIPEAPETSTVIAEPMAAEAMFDKASTRLETHLENLPVTPQDAIPTTTTSGLKEEVSKYEPPSLGEDQRITELTAGIGAVDKPLTEQEIGKEEDSIVTETTTAVAVPTTEQVPATGSTIPRSPMTAPAQRPLADISYEQSTAAGQVANRRVRGRLPIPAPYAPSYRWATPYMPYGTYGPSTPYSVPPRPYIYHYRLPIPQHRNQN